MPWQFRNSDKDKPTFSCHCQLHACKFSDEISLCTLQTFHRYLGFEALTAVVMKCSTFWDITQHSLLKVNRSFGKHIASIFRAKKWAKQEISAKAGGNLCFRPTFTLVSCLVYSFTMKMEAICSSETSFDFLGNARGYISEDRTLFPQIWYGRLSLICMYLFLFLSKFNNFKQRRW
jgi:hypothetical protein